MCFAHTLHHLHDTRGGTDHLSPSLAGQTQGPYSWCKGERTWRTQSGIVSSGLFRLCLLQADTSRGSSTGHDCKMRSSLSQPAQAAGTGGACRSNVKALFALHRCASPCQLSCSDTWDLMLICVTQGPSETVLLQVSPATARCLMLRQQQVAWWCRCCSRCSSGGSACDPHSSRARISG